MARSRTSFVKGQSGNRRGRPRVCPEIRNLARQYGPSCIETLAEMAGFTNAPPAPYPIRFAATKELLDRGYGRARIAEEDAIEGKRVVIEYRWDDGTAVAPPPAAIAAPAIDADEAQPEGEVIWSEKTD